MTIAEIDLLMVDLLVDPLVIIVMDQGTDLDLVTEDITMIGMDLLLTTTMVVEEVTTTTTEEEEGEGEEDTEMIEVHHLIDIMTEEWMTEDHHQEEVDSILEDVKD
jgi:hypothetical protein